MKLGIYVQVPFCQTKCTYCNFHTSIVSRDRYRPYAEAVCREIVEYAELDMDADATSHGVSDLPTVDSVYFGGGTPSLLDPSALEKIIGALREHYRFEPAEITLEADPETITAEKAAAWIAAGFNRISLGSQSFDDQELRAAGRMHRRADIFRAVELLRKAGVVNISLDLIAGLAHQSHESWSESVSELLRIRPEHVSVYMLEIDEGSRLGKEALAGGSRYSSGAIPEEDDMAAFYESTCERFSQAGYEHYEISNWGLPDHRSRHNQKYWQRDPYIGFGAGAHSFDGHRRWANIHDSARYVTCIEEGSSPREQIEDVTPEQALEEEFFLGLRRLDGIDLARIERESGTGLRNRIAELRKRIATLASQGLVEFDGKRLRIAPDRMTVSNEVLVELLG